MVNTDFLKDREDSYFSNHNGTKGGREELCYFVDKAEGNGFWEDVHPLQEKLPIFMLQLVIITALTRLLILLCRKTLRQPRFVAELLAGLLISPSLLGFIFSSNIFAIPRIMILETAGNLGLTFHLFLLGLDMDLRQISRTGSKSISIGIAGALVPFTVGSLIYAFRFHNFKDDFGMGCLYWGTALSVTGLPVITDMLAKLKLLHSELGRIAMSSAFVNETLSWVLLMIAFSISGSRSHAYLPLFSAILFVVISMFLIRPIILWVIKRMKEGEDNSEMTVCIILSMVLACGVITDMCGLSSMIGAFVFGLIIPPEMLGQRFLVMLQGFVSDLLMPLYYACVGFRMDFKAALRRKGDVLLLAQVATLSFLPKFVITLAVSLCYKTPFHEAISLAILMNTKSLLSVIAVTSGRDQLALTSRGYCMMIITVFIMTFMPSPIMHMLHKPTKPFIPSKHRALQKIKPDVELRIIACVHELQTVPGIAALLKISNATRQSPISVFALQLIQLTKHITALQIVHGSQNSRRVDGQTDQMSAAFMEIEEENPLISVFQSTIMSAYATIHEDVISKAEDMRVSLIILPFHKKQTIHNKMEDMNVAYKAVNDNVLANAPCSIGILVDRGLKSSLGTEEDKEKVYHIAVVYIGGPDDREALAYAWRMVGQPNVFLTVLRFIPGDNAVDIEPLDFMEDGDGIISMTMDMEAEKKLDEIYVNEFRHKAANYNSIVYLEKMSNNGAETVEVLRSVGEEFDLYIVGRGLGMLSPLKAGLDDWSECPELGVIGDLLVTSDISSMTSVLVMQQYSGLNPGRDGLSTPDSCDFKLSPASIEPFMKFKMKNDGF